MQVYAPPASVKVPEFNDSWVNGRFDLAANAAANQKFLDDLKAELVRTGFTGKLTGKLVRLPWADGCAMYMVADAPRRTCLIHCPLDDAWHVPEYQTRGLRKSDIARMAV